MRNMNKMFNYIKLIRPKHYIKNFLIFVPLFFSRELFTVKLYYTVLGYITFCFLASAVYVFNDLKDVEKDRRNPFDMEKLTQLADILQLSREENDQMLNLAGKKRNAVAPDLPGYIMNRDYVSAALRAARDLDAGEEEWNRFVEELKNRKKG